MAKVKSSLLAVYIKTTAEATDYSRLGANCESLTINLNPTETDSADVTMDTTQTDLESYKVTIEGTGKYEKGDPVYDMFYEMYRSGAVLDDSKRDVIIVHRFDANKSDLYTGSTVTINSITLNGASTIDVDFKISQCEDKVAGTATVSATDNYKTATFTADSASV